MGILTRIRFKISEYNPLTAYGRSNLGNKTILTKRGREYRTITRDGKRIQELFDEYQRNPTPENYDKLHETVAKAPGFMTEAEKQEFLTKAKQAGLGVAVAQQKQQPAQPAQPIQRVVAPSKTTQQTLTGGTVKRKPKNVKAPQNTQALQASSLKRGVVQMRKVNFSASSEQIRKIDAMDENKLLDMYKKSPDIFDVYFSYESQLLDEHGALLEMDDDQLNYLIKEYEIRYGVL